MADTTDMAELFEDNMFKPLLNIGALMDIPTGSYYTGKHGESILSGGHATFVGVVGRGNTFKSMLSRYINLVTIARYDTELAILYDTEGNIQRERVKRLAKHIDGLNEEYVFDETNRKYSITDNRVYGDLFYERLKLLGKSRQARLSKITKKTPFVDINGNYKEALSPLLIEIDSISEFKTAKTADVFDKSKLGDSSNNMNAMTEARLKGQVISNFPNMGAINGYYITVTGHVGDKHQMEKFATNPKHLSFMKNNTAIKRASENFTFLTNHTWSCHNLKVLENKSDKTCEYPNPDKGTFVGDAELIKIYVTPWRSKSGSSGIPFQLVFSQNDGLQVSLSELNHLRENKSFKINGKNYEWGFGCEGSSVSKFKLEIYPQVVLTRTNVREKIKGDYKLRRAFTITSEMHQIFSLHTQYQQYVCTPAELYNDLVKMGYNWDQLLETRGYWVFNDSKEPRPFLSTLDLLKMRVGEYTPYWLNAKKSK